MTRPHGHYLRYNAGCRCDECRTANNVYKQQVKIRHARGTVSLPRKQVRRHLRKLLAQGASVNGIARAAGVRPESVRRVLDTKVTRPVPVKPAQAMLDVTLDDLDDSAVVAGRFAHDIVRQLLDAGITLNRIAIDGLGWGSWPGTDYPRGRVTLGVVRKLRAYLDEVTQPACERCGAEPLAGGRWCWVCFHALSTPERYVRRGCGTDAGYTAHRRAGTDPCQGCRDAHAAANRRRSAA